MSLKAKFAVAMLLLSALGLVLGALVLPWWTGVIEGGSFQIDLRHMTMCLHNHCGSPKALSAADASAAPWAKVGIATMAASLMAALLAAGVAMRMMLSKEPKTLPWVAGILALFAGLLGAIFTWAHPDFGDWTPSYGMACTLAGALGAATMSIFAGTMAKPKA
jgi:hypothetical protein